MDMAAQTPEWHALNPEEALARLEASAEGLSDQEAAARLARHGRNELPAPARPSALARFAAQFASTLVYVLLGAGAVTAALGHYTDAGVILGVVLVNAIVGYVQEGKAERALEAVRAMLASSAVVLRAGRRVTVAAAELVPGDVVLLSAGDRVPADVRLLRARNLRIDEAALTGESVPVDKRAEAVAAAAPLAERACMAYAGTVVAYGQATGVVCETGARTELGRIGALVARVEPFATPLARKLDQFGRRLTAAILAAGAGTFAFGVLVHRFEAAEMFLAVVGLAVAAVPEGLPAIVTITLAIGTQKMARRKAIVRRLPAVEALGSVTVICTDKTGTLTRNEMTVVRAITAQRPVDVSGAGYAPEGGFAVQGSPLMPEQAPDLVALAQAGLLCNDAELLHKDGAWQLTGDPTEGALVALAIKAGLDPALERREWPRIDEIPFESERQMMATLHHDRHRHARIVVKGAPERVLPLCVSQGAGDGAEPVDRALWARHLAAAASAGERVLAIAIAEAPAGTTTLADEDLAPRFRLLGLACMSDPPRPEAIAAIAECRSAGVRVRMITGDHAATAHAIGRALGLGAAPVLEGREIDALDDAALRARLAQADVIARASPQHKLRLVQALQADGELVAMTGDGANDAPALKRADVGIAMGRKGTDAAREAASIVLADDNFATIANAVREGRAIYDNIKKALVFVLPTNGGEAGVILLAVFLGLALPVSALQILWINMVTTITLDLALAFEPAERDVMRRPPRPPREPLITRLLLLRVAYVSALLIAMAFWLFQYELDRGRPLEAARCAAVNMLVFGELVYLFNCRHYTAPAWGIHGFAGNPVVAWVSAAVLALQLAFTYVTPMQQLFGTAALDAQAWLLVLGLSAVKFAVVEGEKLLLRRFRVAGI